MTNNVLIFGPTGGVGRAAAITASKDSSTKVWLAMRDTSKAIPGLDESSGNFARIEADLSKPETLTSAVQQSGATSAFVYTIMESQDAMKASFEALKAAGITYAVILSSFSVIGDARDPSNQSSFIPRVHALTEIALEESGIALTALRPAAFASNVYWNKGGIAKGEVEILYPSSKYDFIAPEDIGHVGGVALLKGQATEPLVLVGPQLIDSYEAWEIISKGLGKEIKVKDITEEQYHENMKFVPLPVRESIVEGMKSGIMNNDTHAASVGNIKKYGGAEPTKFVNWVESHKADFSP